MKFIATTSDKIDSIPIVSGQLIFSRDDRVIYLDTDIRTSFQQIITLIDDDQRLAIQFPLQGCYFVKGTKILWTYENGKWIQITEPPKQEVVYGLPDIGEENVLYMEGTKLYRWDKLSNSYIEMGIQIWEAIS